MLEYKGYQATVEFDDEAEIFHGEVTHLCDVITFQGACIDELRATFCDSIDDYLDWCETSGNAAEKPVVLTV